MTSRERVLAAINHKQPDRIPIDFGATGQTCISVCALKRLRDYLGLPQKDINVFEMVQMLGVVDEDLRQMMKSDVIGMNHPEDSLGVPNTGAKKKFTMPDGTECMINAGNEWDNLPDGSIEMYPQGDRTAPPSIHMPVGGYFFDIIDRAPEVDEDNLTPREDFKNFFSVMSDEVAAQVLERLPILSEGGGYILNTIHNIVGDTRAENIWAAFKAVHDYNEKYFG